MTKLGPSGQALSDSLTAAVVKHPAATRALILEAARAVDRLEDLDAIVDGKGVLNLLRFRLSDDDGKVAEVKFDAVLAEARQQQANLAALVKVITPNLDESAGKRKERDPLDEIAKRRAARRPGPTKGSTRAKRPS